ncbi:hypothetical protein L861_14640 [Litchfieldella anticariensis FP35 = DSM 16096]|uniref:Type II secretion system protein GspC N-terminal domain-containing protein n=1 Tax=Litchfieldella anticariensis (strain DSM 16096 / CECT 5854 / CIP 108499 / LMG 22089 / FP35) TaxID=1121939 RepID=S2KXM5_LITA3|nr:hypothetical protein [Halomonas anticariensis]EPC00164.1 hypothetical protein L861_14640 [Halomonas anticariensis FP35 = DSM 16096]
MNRALLRKLNLPLLAVTLLLLTLCVGLWQGWGAQVEWLPADSGTTMTESATTPASAEREAPPLTAYQDIWQQSLLSPSRSGDVAEPQAAPAISTPQPPRMEALTLTGTLANQQMQLAFFRDESGNAITLRAGLELPSGWLLTQVRRDEAIFTFNGTTQVLRRELPRIPGLAVQTDESDR